MASMNDMKENAHSENIAMAETVVIEVESVEEMRRDLPKPRAYEDGISESSKRKLIIR